MTKRLRAVDPEQVTIHEISQAIRAASGLDKTLGTVVDVLSKRFGVEQAMITLVSPSGELELVASSIGFDDDAVRERREESGASRPPMSLVGVPIKAYGRDLGVLSCARRRGEPYGTFQQDVRLLSIVAQLIGEAVSLSETGPALGRGSSSSESQHVH
ncbi:MAG TPA: hypothetical protein PLZ79_04140 [Burkholderiales bacterium]|nr:hypothetical protein [Burkholderiales bacterium]